MSEYTLRRWRCQGRGPACVRVGRLVRYRVSDLAAWAEAHAQTIEG
ncbi:MAG: helix-turn-helix domain-containing protein [Intrasporangium sp.]|nr:helix-turn-helix domain-containing protein [Intrasporangium sp.]